MNNWCVIRTRMRWEKKVVQLLKEKGIDTFCPLQKAQSQWSDRVKTIEQPLLKSFVFVKIIPEQRTAVRLTNGVVNFVYRDRKPVVVKDKLIESIRLFQQHHNQIEVIEGAPAKEENDHNGLDVQQEKASLRIETLALTLIGSTGISKSQNATTDNT